MKHALAGVANALLEAKARDRDFLARAVELLRAGEWGGENPEWGLHCPWCGEGYDGSLSGGPHHDGCPLVAFLAEVEGHD